MAAICDNCGWSGTSTQVAYGGRCPECSMQIRYDSAPVADKVIGNTIRSDAEFNQRVVKAIKAISFGACTMFPANMAGLIQRGYTLTPKQQQALFNMISRYRKQVSDQALLEYAELRARGAD